MSKASGKIFLAGEDLDWTNRRCLMYALPLYTEVNISTISNSGVIIRQKGHADHIKNLDSFQYNGNPNDYIVAGLYLWNREICPVNNILIDVSSMIPVAAGLGSSAAIMNALFGALSDYYQIDVDVCNLGFRTEHEVIGAVVGSVDFYISQAKGIMLYDNRGGCVKIEFLEDVMHDLDIILLYSGNNSNTAEINKEKLRRYSYGDKDFLTYLDKTDSLVAEGYKAVEKKDLFQLGKVVTTAHEMMSRYLKNSTPYIDELVNLCDDFGAYGTKLTGCGKGGYVFSLISKDKAEYLCGELDSKKIQFMRLTL